MNWLRDMNAVEMETNVMHISIFCNRHIISLKL